MEDAEEVNKIQDTGVCKHRNRKKKTCCPMCAKEDECKKSQTKKKQNKEKDGEEHTESVFERAARIMKNLQKPPPKNRKEESSSCYLHEWPGIKVCKGCPKRIMKEEQIHPNNLDFCHCGPGGFIDLKTKKHCMKECNINFHLQKTCLRGYDQVVEFKEITMADKVFKKLSDEQMEVLHKEGTLQYTIKNKSNA